LVTTKSSTLELKYSKQFGVKFYKFKQEFYDVDFSPSVIRMIKSRSTNLVWHVARTGGKRGVYRVSVDKPGGKRGFDRPKRGWENNKIDLQLG
jgi:hypothetical protein